jgi:hypothetical protein
VGVVAYLLRRSDRRLATIEDSQTRVNNETQLAQVGEGLSQDNVRQLVAEAGENERHFNELQSRYRTLASTWLLATFAGTGFFISNPDLKLGVDRGWAVLGIGVAGAAGIALLWKLDLYVYHRLLEGFFWEAVKLEKTEGRFPRFRHRMIEVAGIQGVWPLVAMFYAAGVSVDILLGAIGFVYLGPNRPRWVSVFAIVLGVLTLLLAPLFFWRAKRPSPCMVRRMWECADVDWLKNRGVCIPDNTNDRQRCLAHPDRLAEG